MNCVSQKMQKLPGRVSRKSGISVLHNIHSIAPVTAVESLGSWSKENITTVTSTNKLCIRPALDILQVLNQIIQFGALEMLCLNQFDATQMN